MNSNTELISIISQMDEQITLELCDSFNDQLSGLGETFASDTNAVTLIKMMTTISNYLQSRLLKSHPDALPILRGIAERFETIIQDPGQPGSDVEELVSSSVQDYQQLKNKLASNPQIDPAEIESLKEVILAIDWEITDQTLNNFETELSKLMERLKPYAIHYSLLKIIDSTGRYVAVNKANAHTDSILFLRSVFETFEQVIQTKDMPFDRKKRLLQGEIKRFQEFKAKLTASPRQAQQRPPAAPARQTSDSTEVAPALSGVSPALSHIKSDRAELSDSDDISPLTALDEESDDDADDIQIVPPALSDKKPAQDDEPKDVMDDLFTVKETPADQLLDAIHLMDVRGSGPDQALSMLDTVSADESEGAKTFTPKRMDNDPIPEIGDRLDEFFSLDDGQPSLENAVETEIVEPEVEQEIEPEVEQEVEPEIEPEPLPDEEEPEPETVVPFDSEDEAFDELSEEEEDQGVVLRNALDNLQAEFVAVRRGTAEFEPSIFNEKISDLKSLCSQDEDKTSLVLILQSALLIIEEKSKEKTETPILDEKTKPKGFFAKLKGIFSG